ncbi:expressed unknown protein [Ectocarpus siliculosus]|uniref:Uncharacterized protein n=1 Tax=Ectocarpus siliculosus TaxID=2880 RepID=D7G9J5_ECTSI|nr:expressed unknown protein [Ectocarpus siliculosus]|eukprot:CBJ33879.1 expressed unknown protein [Ectocarpus siliculosus]
MLEWHNWEVQRAVSAFMLGEITPPRSFLMGNNSSGNNNASADSSGFGGLGGGASSGAGMEGMVDGDVGGGGEGRGVGGGAAGAAPGVLSVVVGLTIPVAGEGDIVRPVPDKLRAGSGGPTQGRRRGGAAVRESVRGRVAGDRTTGL